MPGSTHGQPSLEDGEVLLWSGHSTLPRHALRWLFVQAGLLCAAAGAIAIPLGGWSAFVRVLAFGALSGILPQLFVARRNLTDGVYNVTDRRILVSGHVYGLRVRRAERLADLDTPEQVTVSGIQSVRFGDPKKYRLAGHRRDGSVVHPLILSVAQESGHVLGIILRAQARARSAGK